MSDRESGAVCVALQTSHRSYSNTKYGPSFNMCWSADLVAASNSVRLTLNFYLCFLANNISAFYTSVGVNETLLSRLWISLRNVLFEPVAALGKSCARVFTQSWSVVMKQSRCR